MRKWTRTTWGLIASLCCFSALVMMTGATCDEQGAASNLIGEEDWYYYGWTEVGDDGSSNSFSLTPGTDPGDALETYLGGSVVYP